MNITIHQTDQTIADFTKIREYIQGNINQDSTGIHIFPEAFLCGYPLQDLCLQKPYIFSYNKFIQELKLWLNETFPQPEFCLLMGGLDYSLNEQGNPIEIRNVAFEFSENSQFEPVYTKKLLPNYDIFDEKKYYTAGSSEYVLEFRGESFGILICEDMWASKTHKHDPVFELYQSSTTKDLQLDGIINLSASPYMIGKLDKRISRTKQISHLFKCPVYYVNKVGGEDEILFDGQSFVVNGDSLQVKGSKFKSEIITISAIKEHDYSKEVQNKDSSNIEDQFESRLDLDQKPARLKEWDSDQCQEVLEALCFGLQQYTQKCHQKKFTIALSGGMDSALVLAIATLSLKPGQDIEAIYMPSIYSGALSYELSLELCKNLGVKLTTIPIKFLHSATKNLFGQSYDEEFEGLTDENVQSRLRGMLLYTRSNQVNSLVINTSNKSELAVGYSTQYGDSVGAISLLGDLYKSEVYRLAEHINEFYKNIIPEKIISREPSAELKPDQIDSDSLPTYEILDGILEGILNYRYTKGDLVKLGFPENDINTTIDLYRRNEYKRYQFCPIIKISSKSFGFGYRVPLSKNSNFYHI
jgi:NAD+ synthase (glutamine-hydrolysing)